MRSTSIPYGLKAQIERAAVSVASNITEGQGRLTNNEFRHFLGQARGSLLELETQMIIARELGYIDQRAIDTAMELSGEVSRMLHALIQSMSPKQASEPEPATGN